MSGADKFVGDAFEAFGEWYLTHSQEQPFVGVLSFKPDYGLELRVVDPTGREGLGTFQSGRPRRERISAFGHTLSHGHISLFDGFVRSKPMSSHGPAETVYFFNRGFLGLATPNAQDQLFASIFATCDLLRVWLDQKLVMCNLTKPGRTISLRHKLSKPMRTPIDRKTKLHIAWDRDGPSLSVAQCNISITSRPRVGLDYAEPQAIDSVLGGISSATRLISVLSGFEFSSTLFQLWIPKNDPQYQEHRSIYFLGCRKETKGTSEQPLQLSCHII